LNAEAPGAGAGEAAPAEQPERRGLRGLKAAKSLGRGGLQAVASLRSGGGLQGAAAGLMGGAGITLMRVTGPGRVGIQSMYQHAHTE
jgi:hypothetical protein